MDVRKGVVFLRNRGMRHKRGRGEADTQINTLTLFDFRVLFESLQKVTTVNTGRETGKVNSERERERDRLEVEREKIDWTHNNIRQYMQ